MDETSRTDPGDAHAAELDHVTSAKAARAVQVWQLFKYADALDCLLMAVGTCGAMAHGMVLPINMHFFGRIVNSLGQNQHAPAVAAAAVAKFALVMFIVALNSAWVTWLEVACWMHTGERQSAKIRTKYLESLLHQEVAFFDSGVGSGEVVSRIAEDTLLVHEAIGEKVGSLIHNLTTFAGGLAVALVNSPPLALLTLAVVPLLSVSGAFFNGKYMALAAQTQQKCTQASNVVEQTISQVRTVYSFVGETRAVAAFSKALEAATKPRLMSGLVKGLGIGFSLFFLNSSWALQLWYGSKLVAKHGTDGGKILTTVFCVVFGGMALGQATLTLQIVSRGRVAAYNIFQVIDRKSAIDSRAATGQILSSLQGRIELDNVCFAYPSRPEATIFNGLSLTIPEARSTALVGGSGSGKSTVISLIQRLYDVSSGEIRIDGADIRSLQLSWMRSTMGLVAQEPALFATTIRANICLGAAGDDVEVSQEQVEEAAKAANAHSFISDLPAGYDTLVGERGVQLSGGQKQRIAIARAIVRSPKILLLDEATSALDAASERLVQEAVDKLMVGRTTLVVAHRLSTIKHCDHIAVFHQGRIVEMGSHEELVSNPDGVYSSLVQVQEIGTQSGTGAGNAYGGADDEVENAQIPATPRFPSPFEANSKVKPGAPDAASPSLYKLLPEGPGAGIGAPPPQSGVLSSVLRRNWYIFLKIVGAGQRQSSTMVPESAFTVRDFHKMVGAEWISVGLGSICAVVSGSLNPLFAFFLIDVVTLYYDTGRRPGYVREHVDRWCLLYAALALVAVFSNSAQHYLFARTGDRVSKKMRERAFEAVMKNEVGWFDREENGSSAITARLASDAALVDGAVSDSTSLLVQYVASALIAMTMGFVIKWQMALITILTFPFSMAGGSMKQGFMSKGFSGDLAEMHDKAMSLAGEAVSNIRTVASLGGQGKVVHLFKQQLSSPAREILVRSQIGGLVFGISQAALHSGNAMGLWYVSVLVARGEATYSEALKVFQVLAWTGYVLAEALSLFPDIKRGILGGQTLGSVTRRATQIDPDHGLLFVPTTGSILLDKVSFSYPSRPDVPVLRDLSLRVETGTTAALVGASGSGKSSIFSLLLRFYDPAGGSILLDGVHITTVNLRSLRQSMSLVQQEPALFGSLSIGDNIRYGNEHASEAEVVKAATLAHAHTFISALPDGYRTQVGERGVHLSGGQKQRIAIARAVLKDAPILLLDEATSALDAASESAVLEALEQQRPRKTMLVIAHRLSTVQNAQVIFAMHNGRVVESGTHGDLLANAQGLYSHLVGINSKIGGAQPLDEPAG